MLVKDAVSFDIDSESRFVIVVFSNGEAQKYELSTLQSSGNRKSLVPKETARHIKNVTLSPGSETIILCLTNGAVFMFDRDSYELLGQV